MSRRKLSIMEHELWAKSLLSDNDLDELELAELNPPAAVRKDSELARVLDLLDNLPTGKDAE